jgi:AcrR family transcriptional regulator
MSGAHGTRTARPDTRRELLDATRRVIQRDGLSNATVGEITREAGASLGLLNYHFHSKDDVVAEAFAALAGEELAELEQLSRAHERPADRLVAFLDSLDWDNHAAWRVWIDSWGQSVRTEALRGTLERFARGWRSVLEQVLADGVQDGSWNCTRPDQLAGRLVAAFDGIGLHATIHDVDVPPARAAEWARQLVEAELGITLPARGRPPAGRVPAHPHVTQVAIRVRDLDAAGAVLPAVHLTYLDEARSAWLEGHFAGSGSAPDTAVAQLVLDFQRTLRR